MDCYKQHGQSFDITQFKQVLEKIQLNKKEVFAGLFSSRTKNLVEGLEKLCTEAIVLRLAKDKKLQVSLHKAPELPLTADTSSITRGSKPISAGRKMGTNSENPTCFPSIFTAKVLKHDDAQVSSPTPIRAV